MEAYTLIWVKDRHARPQQISVPKARVKQATIGLGVLALLGLVAVWDYWRLRADNVELAGLRIEAAQQREEIALFEHRLEQVDSQLGRVADLERKIRIIANLPGATGVGGESLVEPMPMSDDGVALPVGVPVDATSIEAGPHTGQGGDEPSAESEPDAAPAGGSVLQRLDDRALGLRGGADRRAASLERLLDQLEDKREKLVSMPSIWPSRGWLTSRFGPRVSPFTGRRQQHGGIDIAAARGTPIVAPARARVTFVGKKGPLGNALVLDHGFGVKTVYGHTEKIFVRSGEKVDRGQQIASIGSSGRSTGPHLHYVVEVNGKARDPLDYIFD